MNVSACLVTRGDVDLTAIIASLPYDDVVVWDNSKRRNLRTYGRYLRAQGRDHEALDVLDRAADVAATLRGQASFPVER